MPAASGESGHLGSSDREEATVAARIDAEEFGARSPVQTVSQALVSLAGLRPVLLEIGVITAFVGCLMAIVNSIRPLPFATTDDGITYYGPVIKLHTDAALRFAFPRMFWELGSGWSPYESSQAGVFYPLYHLSNLLARLIGRPLALLEVSAVLHFWLAGLICILLLPKKMAQRDRIAWSLLAVAQPAPFLLGLNWHSYLTPYPWFLAIAILLIRNESAQSWTRKDRWSLLVASALMYACAHPHMYILSILALALWISSVKGRKAVASVWLLGCAQLPFAIPTLYLRSVAAEASPNYLAGRDTADFILFESQNLKTVVFGIFSGNLLGDAGFRLWQGVSWMGQGMFFAPWLLWSGALAFRYRRLGWPLMATFMVLVMGIASIPQLAEILAGPFGFRWTWKIASILSPLGLLTIVAFLSEKRAVWLRTAALCGLTLASTLVCIRGLDFDLFPSAKHAHRLSVEGIAAETKTTLSRAGVAPGSRIALIGQHAIFAPVPVPIVGLTGNAPLSAGYETAHVFEPLENFEVSKSHYGLSTPWRVGISSSVYRSSPEEVDYALMRVGVDALVTAVPDIFPSEESVAVADHAGRMTYIRRLRAETLPRPWDLASGMPRALERLAGGKLRTLGPQDEAPSLGLPRPIEWESLADGRWEGMPIVFGEFGELWVLSAVLIGLASVLLVLRIPRLAS